MDDDDALGLPIKVFAKQRFWAMLLTFPRSIAKVVGQTAKTLEPICPDGVRAYGNVFMQLNNHGPFARTVDPSIDLKAVRQRPASLPVVATTVRAW